MYKVFIPIQRAAKGFADRNLLHLGGEPLWKRCLCRFSDFQVFVDTDCDDILEGIGNDPALKHVRAYSRSTDLRKPTTTVNDLIAGFLDRFNINHEPVVQLHVTTPFLRPSSVKAACEKLHVDSTYDSAVGCTVIQKRFWRKEEYGFCPVNHNPLDLQPSNALPELYLENSTFFIFEASVFRQTSNRVGFRPWFQPVQSPENLEIKSEEDWKLAQWFEQNHIDA